MAEFGFTQAAVSPPNSADVAPEGYERRYGLADLEHAQSHGYGVGDVEVEEKKDDPVVPEQPESWHVVAKGLASETPDGVAIPHGGCRGEARRALAAGAPDVDLALPERLAREAGNRAEQDSRVQEAFAAWSECMARSGYDYAEPSEANNDDRWFGKDQPQPTPEQIAVATADVTCKRDVDLITIWASVDTAYERQAIEQHAEALATIAEYRGIEMANALAILGRA